MPGILVNSNVLVITGILFPALYIYIIRSLIFSNDALTFFKYFLSIKITMFFR